MAFFWGVRISSHGNGASLRTIQKYSQEFMASVCFVFFFVIFWAETCWSIQIYNILSVYLYVTIYHPIPLSWCKPTKRHYIWNIYMISSTYQHNIEVTLGNAGSSPDRLNNVEKVLLLGHEGFSSGLCIARVNAYKGVSAQAPQPFSLVASGFQLAQCAAPVRVIDCGNYGTAARIDTKWTCQCVWPYLGPFCDQQAQEVPLHLDMTSPVRAEELWFGSTARNR